MSDELFALIALVLCGLALVGVEVFLIPGVSVAGVTGTLALLGAGWFAWVKFGAVWGVSVLVGSAAGSGLLLFAFARSGAGRRMVLQTDLHGDEHAGAEDRLPETGARGIALTPLRPAGTALFGERRVDVVTDGVYIARDAPIVVLRREGKRVVVEELSAPAAADAGAPTSETRNE